MKSFGRCLLCARSMDAAQQTSTPGNAQNLDVSNETNSSIFGRGSIFKIHSSPGHSARDCLHCKSAWDANLPRLILLHAHLQ
eukprot:1610584-Amphidinium_carterae.1